METNTISNEKANEEEIKSLSVKSFRESGYLQELNRTFLHPLGLSIELIINDDGTESFGRIWDYQEDPEGIYYDLKNSDNERIERFKKNESFVREKRNEKARKRIELFGSIEEPIKND